MQTTQEKDRRWWVLAGLFLVYAASNGILMHTLPLIYPALIETFSWDEAQVTLPATVLFVVAAISSPPVGVLLDRYSARKVILAGGIGMVAGLIGFSQIRELWHMVAAYTVFALSLSACGIVPTMLVLTRWFRRLRGRATGILLLASSLGASVFPLLLGAGMQSLGWRGTLIMFAGIAAAMAILPAVFLVLDRPAPVRESRLAPGPDADPSSQTAQAGPRLQDAIREPRFYLIAMATGSVWLTVISLLQHQPIYLARDLGLPGDMLPAVFSTFFAFSVAGKLGFGWLSDRLNKGVTLVASIGVLAVSLLMLRNLSGSYVFPTFLYAATAGIGFSGAFTVIQLWIASFYAGASYGKILASLTLFDTLAGALGTRIAGRMRTGLGSYLPVFDLMMLLCTFAIGCILAVMWLERRDGKAAVVMHAE